MNNIIRSLLLFCCPAILFASNPASTTWVKNYVENVENRLRLKVLDAVPGGIVFYTDATNLHGIIVAYIDTNLYGDEKAYNCSVENTSFTVKWNYTSVAVGSGGNNNSSMIANTISSSYSGSWTCNDAGTQMGQFGVRISNPQESCSYTDATDCQGGWVLPSKGDMELLMQNLDNLNAALVANGGTALSGTYWTSSERLPGNSTVAKAWAIIAGQNNTAFEELQVQHHKSRGVRYF